MSILLLFLESKSKVKVKTIAIDFSQGSEIYARIKTELEGLDIGVLGKRQKILPSLLLSVLLFTSTILLNSELLYFLFLCGISLGLCLRWKFITNKKLKY